MSNTSTAGLSKRKPQLNILLKNLPLDRSDPEYTTVHACRTKFFLKNRLLDMLDLEYEYGTVNAHHKKVWRPAKQGSVASAMPRDLERRREKTNIGSVTRGSSRSTNSETNLQDRRKDNLRVSSPEQRFFEFGLAALVGGATRLQDARTGG